MAKYLKRVIDQEISLALEAMGAVLIEGPKWCGKTTTASQHAKSILKMQDPSEMTNNLLIANTSPNLLLQGDKPRLIDEWQTAPILWDAVRSDVDQSGKLGQYILTGSSSPPRSKTMHSGTGRIARVKMSPMSLFESLESSGVISIKGLFDGSASVEAISQLELADYAFLIGRGGWPSTLKQNRDLALYTMEQYLHSIYNNDINEVDETSTDPSRVEAFLRSYARNVQTLASDKSIMDDIAANDSSITAPTFSTYMDKLQRMFIIEETPAWSPNIRSKTAIRTANKRGFIDPSLALAALNITPDYLLKDFNLFGFLFEALCMRDLRVYARSIGGQIYHYRDQYGLECDAVIRLKNGDYALIEIKLGGAKEDDAAKNLLHLESLLEEKQSKPAFKMILTAGKYAYKRPDGVYVVPLACLKH